MQARPVVNMSDFEDKKENFQPLKGGRSMAKHAGLAANTTGPIAAAAPSAALKPATAPPTIAQQEACVCVVDRVLSFFRPLPSLTRAALLAAGNSSASSARTRATTRSMSGFGTPRREAAPKSSR